MSTLPGCFADFVFPADSGLDSEVTVDGAVDASGPDASIPDASLPDAGIEDPVVQVSAGFKATCARHESGAVSCWGDGRFGQLGNGSWEESLTPGMVTGIVDASDLSVGPYHACAVRESGNLWCWGWNEEGELGNGTLTDSNIPVPVTGLQDVSQVAAGGRPYYGFTCAVHSGGSVSCWGENHYGQLGNGSTIDSEVPVAVTGLANAVAVRTGAYFACARRSDGTIACWGDNTYGQLGNSTTNDSDLPVAVTGITDATALFIGDHHVCALRASGETACWGDNGYAQLGDGTKTNSNVPLTAQPSLQFHSLGLTRHTTCGQTTSGQVYCWGDGYYGELGNGTWDDTYPPVLTQTPIDTRDLAGSWYHLCALTGSGAVHCWGSNDMGQLGTGERSSTILPEPVGGSVTATDLAAGTRFTCAVNAGAVLCWGANNFGQLGDGTTIDRRLPGVVSGLDGSAAQAVDVDVWSDHACAQLSDGTLRCWGRNSNGQLGDASTGDRTLAVTPLGLGDVSSFTVGGYHSCAVLPAGGVSCWGGNNYGQLGDGTDQDQWTPVAVVNVSDASAVYAGRHHSCVILASGTDRILCWGDNDEGTLGDGTLVNSSAPVVVTGLPDARLLALGRNHGCALRLDGTVACWGSNASAQLSLDPSVRRSEIPVTVPGLSAVTHLTAGENHTCATQSTGRVLCWGDNQHRQSGSEWDHWETTQPVEITNLSDAVSAAAGEVHTCALSVTGELVCWGSNPQGELGTLSLGTDLCLPAPVTGLP